MTKMQHFLLVFDHHHGDLVSLEQFGSDSEHALARYAMVEDEHQADPLIEIVLIGSDDLATVKLTHANYFDGTVAVSKYLAGI